MNKEHARRMLDFQALRVIPLTAVLERYGTLGDMKRIGDQLFGACPIHKGTGANRKQFVVNPQTSEWKCFSPDHTNDSGGGTLEFVAQMENTDIATAAELLASWFALPSGKSSNQQPPQRRKSMSGEKPSHKAFVVEDRGENSENAFWTRCGSAWPHKDGKGLNVQLASGLAVSGRLVLREFTEEDAKEEEQQKAKRKK